MLAILGIALAWLAQLPFGIAGLWWDRRHGIAKLGYLDWILDSWTSLAGEALGITLSVLVVMALAGVFRKRWWLAAVPAFVAIAALVTFVSPFLITDLRDLNRPGLAADAKRLERSLDTGDIPVKVQRVRRFTTAPNAEAVGLGPTRRVILWDTLLDRRFTRAQVRMVLAHELGHHERRHLLELLAWFTLFALPGTYVIAKATERRGGVYRAETMPLALFVVVVLQLAALPLQNAVTRRLEAEADWVSLQATRDPQAARNLFKGLASTSRSEPDPPTWAYLLFENHPTIAQRIAMANQWEERK
jgi:STE24 endopeptidase